jgi:hypothetical protein
MQSEDRVEKWPMLSFKNLQNNESETSKTEHRLGESYLNSNLILLTDLITKNLAPLGLKLKSFGLY